MAGFIGGNPGGGKCNAAVGKSDAARAVLALNGGAVSCETIRHKTWDAEVESWTFNNAQVWRLGRNYYCNCLAWEWKKHCCHVAAAAYWKEKHMDERMALGLDKTLPDPNCKYRGLLRLYKGAIIGLDEYGNSTQILFDVESVQAENEADAQRKLLILAVKAGKVDETTKYRPRIDLIG